MAIRKDVGYLLPDTIDPEAAVCIRVYVPDAPEYIAAFWGSYEFLTAWIAWEKDDDHRGKDAAAVWKPYFEQAREEYLCSQGECGMTDVRQKPGAPCILQKIEICGGSWVDFADLRLCAFGVDDMLYEEGDSWKEIDDILWQLKTWLEQIDAWLTAGKDATEIKYLMATQIGYLKGLETIIDNMAAMTEGQRDAALAALDWDDIRSSVYCDGKDCWPDYGILDTYYGWLDCTADWIFDTLNETANDIFDTLNVVADWIFDALNLAPIARAASGGGSGFGGVEPICAWSKIFTWDISKEGWDNTEQSTTPPLVGDWNPPNGWLSEYATFPGGWAYVTGIGLVVDTITLTKIKVKITEPDAHYFMNHYLYVRQGGVWVMVANQTHTQGTNEYEWTGSVSCEGVQVAVATADVGPPPPTWNESTLGDVTLEGVGNSPF